MRSTTSSTCTSKRKRRTWAGEMNNAQSAWTWTWRNVLYVIGINPDFTVEAVRAAVQSFFLAAGPIAAGLFLNAWGSGALTGEVPFWPWLAKNFWPFLLTTTIAPYLRA